MITLGGDAELELVDSLDPFTEGVVFSVRPPKKSWKNISNLSGGEKTLSSLALVSGTKIISLWIWEIALGTLFMYCRTLFANNKFANRSAHSSAVHRGRRAGAGVLTYFAGAGVCSPPVKL